MSTTRGIKEHCRAGFSLLEVMIASSVFMMMALGFSAGLISAIRTQQLAQDRYIATTIARNRIQRARTLPFVSLNVMQEDYVPIDETGNFAQVGQFRRSTIVSNISPSAAFVQVNIYVPLRKLAGFSDVPVSITTILTERDLIGNSI